jgi:hypothetical protein
MADGWTVRLRFADADGGEMPAIVNGAVNGAANQAA